MEAVAELHSCGCHWARSCWGRRIAATCCTMFAILSVVNERISFLGELLSAVAGVSRWVLWV